MSNELPIINRSNIPEPCPMAWDDMTGDEKTRHCSQCEKSVYHLSYMTPAEANRVIEEHDGNLCIHGVFRVADGQLVTKPTRRQRLGRLFRRAVAMSIGFPLIAILSGCGEQKLSGKIGEWVKPDEPEVVDQVGKMVEEGGYVMSITSGPGSDTPPQANDTDLVTGRIAPSGDQGEE